MAPPIGVATAIGVIATTIICYGIYCWWTSSENVVEETGSFSETILSNPNNNHDDQKHPHRSREEAEFEAKRMGRQHPQDTYVAYYNEQKHRWFVGRKQY